jgi:hypothetical protein
MLKFNARNIEELQEEVNMRSHEVSVAIVRSICEAIESDVDHVEVGSIVGGGLSIGVGRPDFITALKTNLPRCGEAEEFELCARAMAWIKLAGTSAA